MCCVTLLSFPRPYNLPASFVIPAVVSFFSRPRGSMCHVALCFLISPSSSSSSSQHRPLFQQPTHSLILVRYSPVSLHTHFPFQASRLYVLCSSVFSFPPFLSSSSHHCPSFQQSVQSLVLVRYSPVCLHNQLSFPGYTVV